MTPAERALYRAAEDVLIHYGMGWELDAVMDALGASFKAIPAVEAEAADSRPLGEPCRSCTGHIRENNPIRCAECSPTAHQNYVARDDTWNPGEEVIGEPQKATMRAAAYDPEPLTEGNSCSNCAKSIIFTGENCPDGICRILPHQFRPGWKPKPTDADICPTCHGLGFGLPSGPKQDTTCPTCEGDGRDIAGGRYVNCPGCNGTGKKETK